MKTLSRLFFIAVATVALSWFLSWLYNMVFPQTWRAPFVQYSPLTQHWVVSQFVRDYGDPDIFEVDKQGDVVGHYTVEQRDSLLPQVYYGRLMARGLMPDSICGVEVSMQLLRRNENVMSVSPRNVAMVQPEVWLIMESMPERFSLEDPKEAFRLTDDGRVEFITIATNTVNAERSRRFTDAFARNGFKYPARSLNANITTRKAYDNGYLLVDSAGVVFHMKQQAGRPYMTRIEMPDGETASCAFINETINREETGLVVTDSGHVYRLMADYELQPVPGLTFDMARQKLMVVGNYFNRVYRVGSDKNILWYAVDSATGELLDTYSCDVPESVSQHVAAWLFPFSLCFTGDYDSYAFPRIVGLSPEALVLGAVLAIFVLVVYRRRRMSGVETVVAMVATVVLGIYVFVPILLISK